MVKHNGVFYLPMVLTPLIQADTSKPVGGWASKYFILDDATLLGLAVYH